MVQNRQKVALGQDKQKAYIILNGNFPCLCCPSATFVSQHGGFLPRKWKAAKGLSRAVQPTGTSSMIVVMLAREKRET